MVYLVSITSTIIRMLADKNARDFLHSTGPFRQPGPGGVPQKEVERRVEASQQ